MIRAPVYRFMSTLSFSTERKLSETANDAVKNMKRFFMSYYERAREEEKKRTLIKNDKNGMFKKKYALCFFRSLFFLFQCHIKKKDEKK